MVQVYVHTVTGLQAFQLRLKGSWGLYTGSLSMTSDGLHSLLDASLHVKSL